MFREKQANMRANGATRRLRKAMAVVLTIAMVSTQTPLASAADRVVQATASEQAQSATPSVQSEQPTQAAQADAQPTQDAQSAETAAPAAAPVEAGDVEVALTFDHAYIEVDGQVVAAPATKVTLPANRDARIVARADEGYAVSRVTLAASGATTTLEADPDGAYVISADQLAGATALSVAATPAQGTQSASDAVPLDQEKKDEFTFEDDAVKVTAKLEKSGAIPADATLRVTPVAPDSGAYNYNAYLDALNGAAADGKQHNEKNTLMYDVAFVTRGADGALVEVQPAEGSVSVSFQFKQGQISRGLAADSAADVQVTHLPLTDAARRGAKTTAEATAIAATDVSVENLSGSDVRAKGADAIEVKTDSLSVFALSYTVDFTYDGYAYSLPGEGSIRLSELFSALGISASAADATSVEFSNPDLVEVARDGSDWRLTSRAPFLTRETLTAHMADGSTYVVNVTDAQTSSDLAAFLTDANIVAPTNAEGAYVVVPGSNYSIKLTFRENKGLQFPDDGRTMTYRLPDGIAADGHEGSLTVKVNDGGTTYTIPNNHYHITGSTLYFDFNASDPNFAHLTAAGNLAFTLSFEGAVAEDAKKVTFADGVEKSLDVDTTNSVSATKSAVVNKEAGTVDYTVAVVSKGHSKNVVVEDALTGEALTLDAGSIRATSSKGRTVDMVGSASGNSFRYTIGDMSNGEVVTLTYSARIDVAKIPVKDGKVVSEGTNKVRVKSDGDPTPDEHEIHTTIDYTPDVSKRSGHEVSSEGHTKTYSWNIVANGEAHVSMANTKITDTIDEGARSIMKYSGDGIQVKVYDGQERLVRTDNVAWSDLAKKSDSEWTYVVPASDAGHAYRYEISYTTDVDLTGKTDQVTVKNTVTTDGGKTSTGESHVTPIGDNDVKVFKSAEKVDFENREVTWKSDFTVPSEGLTEAVLTDEYPNQWYQKSLIIEKAKHDSIKVSGLLPGESYTVEYGDHDNPRFGENRAIITFYQDEAHATPGLRAGRERTVSVELKTEISEELVQASKNEEGRDERINTVRLDANGQVKTTTAKATVLTPEVSKTVKPWGTRTVGGVELPIYKYEVILSRPTTDTEVVYDEYDTSLLEPYETGDSEWEGSWYVFGGTIWSQSDRGGQFSHVMTDKGMRFDVPASAMPHDSTSPTGLYDRYKLVYYLTVKDEAALQRLVDTAASSPDHKATIHNDVRWEDHTGGVDVDYEYQALKKELLTPDSELSKTDEDVRARFRITLNPAGQVLNDGNPLTMTDTNTNLSIDPESIKATPADGVTWDVSGHTTTFQIPDATPVTIEYAAHVVFGDVGGAGETKSVTFSNTAEMNGYKKDVEKVAYRKNSGTATASVPAVKLLKYEAGNMGQRLGGATFALLDANKQPVQGNDGPVTFTTKADGTAYIRGDQSKLGWSLDEGVQYYLRETHAPQGHMLTSGDIPFKITTDGTSDPDRGIYEMSDTISVKNYAGTDVHVEKSWTDGSTRHGSDTVQVKLQQRLAGGDWSDTIREHAGDVDSAWTDTASKTLAISAATGWKGDFKNLPLTVPAALDDADADDVAVEYRVVETLVNGEAPAEGTSDVRIVPPSKEDGSYLVTITNTPAKEYVEASVRKVWDDADNRDGKRPASIKVALLANGKASGQTVTLSSENGWTAKVADLPKTDDANKEIAYTWSEETLPEGYSLSSDKTDGTLTTLTNSYSPESTTASVKKVWDDANDQDGKRPASITVTLTANGKATDRTVTLDAANGWSASISGLPAYEGGKKVAYAWDEKSVPEGYQLTGNVSAAGLTTITNKHVPETCEATIKKAWDDANDQDGKRPESIKVQLLANGKKVGEQTLSAAGGWSATVRDLPVFEGGKKIEYSWGEESLPEGYAVSGNVTDASVTTITNKHVPETREATVKKVWDDAENQDGLRPASITVRLSDGQKVTLDAANGWSATLKDLPVYAGGEKIDYAWTEEGLPAGYKLSGTKTDGTVTTITNTHAPEKTKVSVKKVWDDANDQDGKRPESIKVALLANGEQVDEVTLDAKGGWSAEVAELDKKAAGKDIAYTWSEKGLPAGYELSGTATDAGVTTITNKHVPETREATVKKVWDDAENQDGARPASIKVALKAGDATIREVTLDAAGGWTATVRDLPVYAAGEKIDYAWSEGSLPAGYKLSGTKTDGDVTTITNAHTPETCEASVKKVWDDANDQDGKRPASIKVTLTANGKQTDKTVTLDAANGWSAKVSDLDKYEGGKAIDYAWAEDALPAGYELSGTATAAGVTTITNKHVPETREATVKKVWDDANNQDGKRPASLVVTLLANGAEKSQVTLSDANGWSATVKDLPAYEGGKLVTYSWSEAKLPEGYSLTSSKANGTVTTLTNAYKPEQTSATVKKVWDDDNDRDGKRPESIKVALLANGKATDHTVTLSEENDWSATVSGLDKMADGAAVAYTWSEQGLPEGYKLGSESAAGTVTTIVNTHEPAKTEASVKKVWDDDSSAAANRPKSLEVRLLANGQQAKDASGADVVVRLDQSNDWSATVRDLPENAAGKAVAYTWSEGEVPAGYKLTSEKGEGTLTTLTNTYDATGKLEFKGTKHMSGRPFVAGDDFTFTVAADSADAPLPERSSVRIAPKTGEVAALDFGSVSYTLADAGKTYTYTISESGSAAGVTNAAAKTVKVSVADAGDGTLKVTAVEGDPAKLDFTNTYEATGSLELKGTKSMEGRELADGDHFEFDVAEKGGKTVTVGNTGSKIDYPTLEYTLADLGTHTYTVTEHKVDKDGVKSDARTYTMVVTVADDVRDGKLEVKSTGADPAKLDFTNTYDARADFPLDAHKTIEGRDFGKGTEADRYTFSVTANDAKAPLPERSTVTVTPTSGRDTAIDFGKIAFTLADAGKTYTYTIRESGTVAGVTNSAAKTVTLKVTDDGKGNLKVERTGGDELPLTFKNTYDAKGTATVQATKSLVGRAWKPGETYAFAIEAKAGAPEPEVKRAIATAQGVPASFGAISYTLADAGKTFDYTIREVAPTDDKGKALTEKDGVTYTSDTHVAHVSVSDKGDGTLTTRVTYDLNKADAPTFQNTYGAAGTTTLEATKTIEGRDFNENDAYTFTVSASTAGAPMPEHPSVTIKPREGRTAAIDFGTIAYTLDDAGKTFVYDVTESAQVAGVTNDSRTHRVTVRVTDAGNGTLSVEKSFATAGETSAALVFANAYDAKGSHELHATKTVSGRDFGEGDSYTFTVRADDAKAPMPERTSVTIDPREGRSAAVDFGKIDYALADAGKAYTYTIVESGTVAGVTNDVRTHTVTVKVTDNGDGTLACTEDARVDGLPTRGTTFTNAYAATGEATLDVHKTLEGRDLKAGEFTFELADDTGRVLQTATNDADGTVAFAPLAYDLASLGEGTTDARAKSRTLHYTVKEKLPAGVGEKSPRQDATTFDTATHDVYVTLTDNGAGTIETSVDYGQGNARCEFRNKHFSAAETLEFEKHYYGADRNASFTFELTAATGDWQPRSGSPASQIDAAGRDFVVDSGQAFTLVAHNGTFDEAGTSKVTLPALRYYEPGTYRYVLSERHASAAANDAAVYHVTVEVASDQTVRRTIELVYGGQTSAADAMAFYNNDQVTLGFTSSALAPQDDANRIASVEPKARKRFDNGSLVAGEFTFSLRDADGRALQTVTNDALGNVAFDRLTFDEPGTYDFTLTEDPGTDPGISYDSHAIGYRVTVTADAKGVLSAKEAYLGSDGKAIDDPTFVNDVRTIEIRAQKRSREAPYDPLAGATYGIWMANGSGNDVYMGNAVSDADGYLRYEVPATQGVAYYLREEKAPHGHLVDPYPTDYFTIGKGANGAFYLVYQYDSDFFALVPDLKGRI